ncbi:phospho-N-acetylmuramoyl-pentapeptide-transferase [cyanobiont of Ornithocercus magnificus]|nr:phospho-N-acetylmuramoyl-pentapeptide-transferase [cyanobiont of Ornithocercus magnificus]
MGKQATLVRDQETLFPARRAEGQVAAVMLIILVVLVTLAADRWIPNSLLTPPLLTSMFISTLVCILGVPHLHALRLNQIIREDVPQAHLRKSGTPTMGGILIVPVGTIVGSLTSFAGHSSAQVLGLVAVTLAAMVIGGLDDLLSLIRCTNAGLTPRGKLLLQVATAVFFLSWSSAQGWISPTISLPWNLSLDIGWLFWPFALLVFIAESNATNLTDGLDGLASGCGALVFTGLALQLILRGNGGDPAIAGFSMAMAGAWLGFLIHNCAPAKVFMGDTGSLAMGSALTGIALFSDSLWPLLVMGGVFFVESMSVILQVCVFKATKKIDGFGYRLLRMAPLHHHFELRGVCEQRVVQGFWAMTGSLVLIGLLLRPST